MHHPVAEASGSALPRLCPAAGPDLTRGLHQSAGRGRSSHPQIAGLIGFT